MNTNHQQQRSLWNWFSLVGLLGAVAGCSGVASSEEEVAQVDSALTAEDGLAQAYSIFKDLFTTQQSEDKHHHIGFGYHPGISTHNGVVTSIEDAVSFYSSPQFLNSPGARLFAAPDQNLFPAQKNDIVAFLRTINALTNIVQVRKRVQYLANNATPGGTQIMTIAIKESQDAISDLTSPTLTGLATANALQALRTVKLSLQNSLPFANGAASVPMSQVLTWLGIAESDLITANPLNDF